MKRANGIPASRSPLTDLEAELRAIERKRREALAKAEARAEREAQRERRFVPSTRIAPGSWSELETTVYLEQVA